MPCKIECSGIKAETINKKYGTSFTWEQLADYFETGLADKASDQFGSKTVLKAIAKLNDELREFRMQELTHEQINYFVKTRQLERFYSENKEILNI